MKMEYATGGNPLQTAWLALRDAIKSEYDAYKETDDGKLALILWGQQAPRDADPDYPCINGQLPHPTGKPNALMLQGPFVPNWALFLNDAKAMLDAMAEMKGADT